MFQLKISAAIFVVVAALMGFAYFAFTSSVTEGIIYEEATELELATRSVQAQARTAELALIQRASTLANLESTYAHLKRIANITADTSIDTSERLALLKNPETRRELFQHLIDWRTTYGNELGRLPTVNSNNFSEQHQANLTRPLADWFGLKPDVLLAFQSLGAIIAEAEEGKLELLSVSKFDFPSLAEAASELQPRIDIVGWNQGRNFVVAYPVVDEDSDNPELRYLGSIMMGYQLGEAMVNRLSAVLGAEKFLLLRSQKTFYHQGRTSGIATSLKEDDTLFQPVSLDADARVGVIAEEGVELSKLEPGAAYAFTGAEGAQYLVMRVDWIPPAGEEGAPRASLFVVSNLSQALGSVDELKYQIPFVGAIILLFGLVIIILIIRRFMSPLEEIDVGIQEILAGNKDYIFRARSSNNLHGELANSLNQVVAYLQGRKPPGEEDAKWDELMVDLEPERPSIYGMQAVKPVQPETSAEEEAELKALYDDYMGKRKELDQHVDMDFDRFVRRIKRNEKKLIEKHGCASVEFSVTVADGKVVLKPTPIFE